MRAARIPLETYKDELVYTFDSAGFNVEEWMRNAKAVGMKYFVITAKYHDGFALFPSDAYPFDIRLTGFRRDPMKELAEAACKYNIKFDPAVYIGRAVLPRRDVVVRLSGRSYTGAEYMRPINTHLVPVG